MPALRLPLPIASEWMLGDSVVGDDPPRHEVVVDDALEHRWVALSVPCALRIDDGDRSALANPEAVGLRSKDPALLGQAQLLQPPLEKIPRGQPALLIAAFRCRGVAAKKDMPSRNGNTNRLGNGVQLVG